SLSECSITEGGYRCLSEAVRSNPSHLISLDLTGNDPGPSGVKLIHQLIQDTNCALNTVRFLKSRDAEAACVSLTEVLGENPLLLKELNLSDNKLRDLDGEKLSALLMDSHSKVETIRLNNCELTEKQCSAVAAVLSCKTLVREMNLNNSRLLDSGLKHICDKLKNPQCQLHILKLLKSSSAVEAVEYLTGVLGKDPLLQREVNLSDHKLDESRVRQISDLLQDKHCKLNTLTLRDCGLTEESCSSLASVLSSNSSVTELDMSNNNLQDSGVKKLQKGLEHTNCKLKKLRLSECSITEEGYRCLSEAVRSNPSHLISLDLSGNDPGPSGVKLIYDLIQDTNCALNTVRFLKSFSAVEAFEYLTGVLASVLSSNSSVTELDMSNNNLQDSGVKKLQKGLEHTNCKLKKLSLSECSITEGGYVALSEAVRSNPSHLISLDLTGNDPGPSGVKLIHQLIQDTNCALKRVRFLKSSSALEAVEYLKTLGINALLQRKVNLSDHKLDKSRVRQISDLLQDKHCKINTLSLSECSITEGGYRCLSEAVRSNPSHLISLDLTGNDPGPSGVKLIHQLIQDTNCALNTVRLLKSSSAMEALKYLTGVLGKNPLLQSELNLSNRVLYESRVRQISDLLQDKHCQLNTLTLNSCRITAEGCAALTAALNENPSHVKELNLSGNTLGDSGIKNISHLMKNSLCTLKKLNLSECSITEEGYRCLSEAVRSNPSHLISLDLSGNDPGPSGVKLIHQLIQDTNCALNTVRFLRNPCAVKVFEYLIGSLGKNPLLEREVNLGNRKLDESRVRQISDLLQDKHCQLNTLTLNSCRITAEGCAALTAALNENPSHVKELNLSGNTLGDSGIKNISHLMKNSLCTLEKLKFVFLFMFICS
ncbi:hypothetical protein IRJ41_000987, partial [Triplophysa rosa]